MIIANGSLQWRLSGGAVSIDPETGFPFTEEAVWGDPMPCQTVPVSADRLARGSAGGERFTDLSFTIYIEEGTPAGEFLRLLGPSGNLIGEYPVKGVEPLDAVRQLRITV
ncbi:MAG: hypothetical protein LUC24_04625 [Bacteroidales bacterium]|nr:hypothetical protein [Bacteroidales bacterium]